MPADKIGHLFGNLPDSRTLEADENLFDSSVFLGLELELEDVGHLRYYREFLRENNWTWVADHSLRGTSCELITQSEEGRPIRGMDVVTALEALDQAIHQSNKRFGTYPTVGVRTSTHIHVDVRDLTPEELSRFIIYYVMFEDIILKSEAPERCNNNYCLPVSKSSDLKADIVRIINELYDSETVRNVVHSWPKYSALNVGAAGNLGTLEFRIFPGSFKPKQILMWINMLLSLRRAAVNNSLDIYEIPQTVSGSGLDVIIKGVFPDDIADRLISAIDPRDVLRGARLIQGILTRPSCLAPRRLGRIDSNVELSNNFKAFKAMQGVT